MTDIRIPQLNANDETYTLVEWLVADSQPVEADEAVATIETSKAAEDLTSPADGVLWHQATAGSECRPGTAIATVGPPGSPRPSRHDTEEPAESGPIITEPARVRMAELGLPLERVLAAGRKLVRAADIDVLAGTRHELSAAQKSVAQTVTLSHQTIPAAYSIIEIDVGAAEKTAAEAGRRLRRAVGLPEVLVTTVAPLHRDFPLLFAAVGDSTTARLPDDAHIAVTVDAGNGLFLPVVRNAARLDLDEITSLMDGFRQTALRGKFRPDELAGANITLTLHHQPGIVAAIPVVFPGQTCSLALTATRDHVVLSDGEITTRQIANLGLAYDHRFVNGRDAALFLSAIKETLESA